MERCPSAVHAAARRRRSRLLSTRNYLNRICIRLMILPAGRVTQRRGEADRGTEKVERVSKGGILRRFRLALDSSFQIPKRRFIGF